MERRSDLRRNFESRKLYYKIDRATTSIQKVENARGVLKVTPTVVNKGTVINVDLGDNNNGNSEISVYSSNGAKVKTITVPAERCTYRINSIK